MSPVETHAIEDPTIHRDDKCVRMIRNVELDPLPAESLSLLPHKIVGTFG